MADNNEVLEVGSGAAALWSTRNEEKFITLMEEEVIKGNWSTTTFTKAVWPRIRETLNIQTNKTYNDVQLRNKFNQLKQRQRHFKMLLKETRIGYNSVTGLVTATEKEWDRLSRVYKFAKRFKKKGCPHYDKLCTIFGDTTTIGANAAPSTQSPPNTDEEEFIADLNFEVNQDTFEEHSDGVDATPTHRRRSRSTTPSTSRHGKRESYSSALTSALFSYSAASKRKMDLFERWMVGSPQTCHSFGSPNEAMSGSGTGTPHTLLKESMSALNELEGIDGAAYTKAIEKFHDDELWRALFLEMPSKRRKDWVLNLN